MENKTYEIIIKKDGEVLHQDFTNCIYACWESGDGTSAIEHADCDAFTVAAVLNSCSSLLNYRLNKQPELKTAMKLINDIRTALNEISEEKNNG